MDDYTWNKKRELRLKRKKKERMLLLLLPVILLGFGLWKYFYAATPEHAIENVCTAIQEKDVETFNKYVNLDLVTSRAYEDLTNDMFAYDKNLDPNTKVMFETFYKKIKPQVVSGTNEILKNYVATGELSVPKGNDILKGRQLGIDFPYLMERAQLNNTKFVSLGEVQRNNRSADAIINVKDTYTDTSYSLHVILEQNADDVWQVVYVSNYRDYLNLIEPLQLSDLNQYIQNTQGIIDNYNAKLKKYQTRFAQLSSTNDGNLSNYQRNRLADFIRADVIPTLKDRQNELDAVEIPKGAVYLHSLRQQSTDLTIKSWLHFIEAMEKDSPEEMNTSKALHKSETDIDNRINDILKHTAVNTPAQSAN